MCQGDDTHGDETGSASPGQICRGMPALIPVRGGSRAVPDKNMQEVGGMPLLVRCIRNALVAARIERVVVSTDCEVMARVAIEEGAEVPSLRPAHLARDDTHVNDVLAHIWRELDVGPGGEGLVLLQATSPFLQARTIDRAVDHFRACGAGVLKGVRPVREHPQWMLRPRGDMLVPYLDRKPIRRQDLPALYVPCGAVYVYGPEYLERPDPFAPAAWIELSWPETVDVDDLEDLELARRLAEEIDAGGAADSPSAIETVMAQAAGEGIGAPASRPLLWPQRRCRV